MPLDGQTYTGGDPILAVIDRVDRLICDEEHWGIGVVGRSEPVPDGRTLDGDERHCPATAVSLIASGSSVGGRAWKYFDAALDVVAPKYGGGVPTYNNAPERTFADIKALIRKARELRLADIMVAKLYRGYRAGKAGEVVTKPFTVTELRCLELARIIREGLEGVRFDMSEYRNKCGTAGCIAGHAIAQYRPEFWREYTLEQISRFINESRQLLGLTRKQADEMFRPWANKGPIAYDITPAMAAATLENYALTGKVEWPKP